MVVFVIGAAQTGPLIRLGVNEDGSSLNLNSLTDQHVVEIRVLYYLYLKITLKQSLSN